MDQLLIAEILTSDSDEIADLKSNTEILDGVLDLAWKIDELPDISKRFFEESRSLYQATSVGRDIQTLEKLLTDFFGPPIKPAGKPLSRKMRNHSSVNYLGGIQTDQSLFLLSLKTGEFYGALWPWRRNKEKIEIHIGYCSDWISDEDYIQIQTLFKRSLSRASYSKLDTGVGGQIHGISLPSFLQMAEMERSTFTLHITADDRSGRLFVTDGNLIDADSGHQTGWDAACRIISWEDAVIEIEPAMENRQDVIKQPLMHVLMESLKIKDETPSNGPDTVAEPHPTAPAGQKGRPPQKIVRLERVQAPSVPTKKVRFLPIGITLLIGLCVIGGLTLLNHMQNLKEKAALQVQHLMHKVDETTGARQKLALLEAFLQEHPGTSHLGEIQNKMLETKEMAEEEDFDKVTLDISNLTIDDHYEKKAIALYSAFLEKYPNSPYTDKINKAISGIKNLLDQYYYEELKRAARLDFAKRIEIYRDYLAHYPRGSYRQDVETLIEGMGQQYLQFLKTEADQCDKNKRWEPCIERCDKFIDTYKNMALAQDAKALRTQLMDKRDLRKLTVDAEAAGNDYHKAYDLYRGYLQQHPQTSQKPVIKAAMNKLASELGVQRKWVSVRRFATDPNNALFERIQRLDAYLRNNVSGPYSSDAQALMDRLEAERQTALRQRQIAAQHQEELARLQREKEKREQMRLRTEQLAADMEGRIRNSSRFRSNGDGTVTDGATGLTWTLLDSSQDLGGCLNYESALAYLRNLTRGGHTDWRLPTASELAAIYKQAPFFPASGAEWYWTSESYAKGYHTVANIVTAKPETVYQREYRPITDCGTVRAVR